MEKPRLCVAMSCARDAVTVRTECILLRYNKWRIIYYSWNNFNNFNDLKYWQRNTRKFLKCITNTAFTYLRNLAGTDYELPEDDAIVSKHVGAV